MPSLHRRLANALIVCATVAWMDDSCPATEAATRRIAEVVVVGDAIPRPLTATPGDPLRGRAIVADRHIGLCLLCHTGPFPDEHDQGTLAPDLSGARTRWSEGQLRLRVVDARRLNPETIMPSYYRIADSVRVGHAWQDQPVLDAQQIEDIVAFLATLR
jgi:sulfur-oxidizing protein SoxX